MTEFSLLQEVAQRHRQGGVAVSLGLSSQSKVEVTKRPATPDKANLIIVFDFEFDLPRVTSPLTSHHLGARDKTQG